MKNKRNKPFCMLMLWLALCSSITSCTTWQDETIESSYIMPTWPDPEYKFVRNDESSVNTLECKYADYK